MRRPRPRRRRPGVGRGWVRLAGGERESRGVRLLERGIRARWGKRMVQQGRVRFPSPSSPSSLPLHLALFSLILTWTIAASPLAWNKRYVSRARDARQARVQEPCHVDTRRRDAHLRSRDSTWSGSGRESAEEGLPARREGLVGPGQGCRG